MHCVTNVKDKYFISYSQILSCRHSDRKSLNSTNSDLETGLAMATNTLCSVCSISKLFTSVAIMQLYEDGHLRLDDTIGDLLPEYNIEQQYEPNEPNK
ncbi:MAG: serine hydrolase domain-containing protein [Candidatus Paceibacterota bacterium]